MKPNGGAAFPRIGEGFGNPLYDAPGMTLRDYFAGQIVSALLSNMHRYGYMAGLMQELKLNEKQLAEKYALDAYMVADAMLAERERGE